MRSPSNFVAAGLPSMQHHLDSALMDHPDLVNEESINKLFVDNVNKFLTSFGVVLRRDVVIDNFLVVRYLKRLNKMISKPYMKNCQITVDSAGYQIQQGYMQREDIPKFIDIYYDDFIINNHQLFDKAFTLDISFGFNFNPFESWKDVKYLNYKSYEKAIQLPDEVRHKMLYIHHFRTPRLYEVSRELFSNMASDFKYFGTGGLVSLSNTKNTPPCVMYVVPLMDVVKHAVDNNMKEISFHVLGETEFKSVLVHCFLEYHVKQTFGIDLTITYDSSTIFKTLGVGRYTYYMDDNHKIWKLPLTSEDIKNSFKGGSTSEDIWYDIINEACTPYGMSKINKASQPMYYDNGGFNRLFYAYCVFQMFHLFKKTTEYCRDVVKKLYPYYLDNDELGFSQRLRPYMLGFNNGRDTRKVDFRISNLFNTLRVLSDMDFDYTKYLVDEYMAAEERDMPEN